MAPPKRAKILTGILNLRLPPDVLDALDVEARAQTVDNLGVPVTRADLARKFILDGIEAAQKVRAARRRPR